MEIVEGKKSRKIFKKEQTLLIQDIQANAAGQNLAL